jgi:hypothetical protein
MKTNIIKVVGMSVLLSTASHANAQTVDAAAASGGVQLLAQTATTPVMTDARFEKFVPKANPVGTQIDYTIWDEALNYFVFRMGKSIRESAPRPEPGLGTRRIYGHDSRFRMEGNRVIFSYLEDEIIASLTEYREDLERTGDIVDISTLSKNEQLAFWINLHNTAIIEQIALAYPVSQPISLKIGDSGLTLDEAPFITVAGVQMSPKDIRTKIVYPNWSNPKVIYGFFRGEIGGPSIQNEAYKARNVSELLDKTGKDFVNSLRGTQKSGSNLLVSEIYEEARPYFFPQWPTDLKAHLRSFAEADVVSIIDETSSVRANIYEHDIADLANGERDPNYGYLLVDGQPRGERVPTAIARLLQERSNKVEKLIKRNDLVGLVTLIPFDDPSNPTLPDVVE